MERERCKERRKVRNFFLSGNDFHGTARQNSKRRRRRCDRGDRYYFHCGCGTEHLAVWNAELTQRHMSGGISACRLESQLHQQVYTPDEQSGKEEPGDNKDARFSAGEITLSIFTALDPKSCGEYAANNLHRFQAFPGVFRCF